MRSDGLAFTVRIGREKDHIGGEGQLFQLDQHLLFAGNDDVFRLEIVLHIHTQIALGQILDVTERGFDGIALA